jgi:hypothetical protein
MCPTKLKQRLCSKGQVSVQSLFWKTRKNDSFAEADYTRYSLTVLAVPLDFLYWKLLKHVWTFLSAPLFRIRSTHLASCSGTKNTIEEQTVTYKLKNILYCGVRPFTVSILHHARAKNSFQIHGVHTFSWRETHRGRYRGDSRREKIVL